MLTKKEKAELSLGLKRDMWRHEGRVETVKDAKQRTKRSKKTRRWG